MKIKRKNYRGEVTELDVRNAVRYACTPSPYSYEGTLEGLQARISALEDILVNLVEVLNLSPEQLQQVLGTEYEVEP